MQFHQESPGRKACGLSKLARRRSASAVGLWSMLTAVLAALACSEASVAPSDAEASAVVGVAATDDRESEDAAAADGAAPLQLDDGVTFAGAEKLDAGWRFSFNLGDQRTNWTNARWSVATFDKPMDLSQFDAVRVFVNNAAAEGESGAEAAKRLRSDVGVTIAVREADGSWYAHPWAGHLNAASSSDLSYFADFSLPLYHNPPGGSFIDENGRLDLGQVTAVAIGVVNPMGIGRISFGVDRIVFEATGAPAADSDVNVQVTGQWLDLNGTTTVPAGLFGGFHLAARHHADYRLAANRHIFHDGVSGSPRLGDGVTHMFINTIGDRVRPSVRLTLKDWEEKSAAMGRRFGEAARQAGKPLYVEYWNEPYLNWANYNRAGFITQYYDVSRATEGGPVHIRHDGAVAPHLIWTKDRRYYRPEIFGRQDRTWRGLDHWRRGRDAQGRVYSSSGWPYSGMQSVYGGKWEPQSHPPMDVKDGETYQYKGKTLTAFTPWHVVDPTQFTYWSGQGMRKFYIDPMLAFGRAMKEAYPESVYIVGWGNRPSEDHWAGFHQLYKATIDAGIDIIDGVNDHDYGGDPLNMSANYEVITAYGVTAHDKWLYGYNTEAASSTDPQVYGDDATSSADLNKFRWVSRKIMHALDYVPDKARVFLHFGSGSGTGTGGPYWSDAGEGVALTLMKNLRGRLLKVSNSDPRVYVVASVDGTDPENPRPASMGERNELVIAVLNDHDGDRRMNLDIAPPPGTRLGAGVMRLGVAGDDGRMTIKEGPARVAATGGRISPNLKPGQLMVVTFQLQGQPNVNAAPVVQRQFFGDGILKAVTPAEPLRQTIKIDQAMLSGEGGAWLQFTAENLGHGEGVVVINGKTHELPAAVTPENTVYIRRVPLRQSDLAASNTVEFRTADRNAAGFMLCSNSIVVEKQP